MDIMDILNRFVQQPGDLRPELAKPFAFGNYTMATDGMALIRVPQIDSVTRILNNNMMRNVATLFATVPGPSGECFEVPQVEQHWEECGECNGSGCEECDGTGSCIVFKKIPIGPAVFNEHLLSRLNGLPNCKLWVESPNKVAWFTFDGGDGLIMPTFRY